MELAVARILRENDIDEDVGAALMYFACCHGHSVLARFAIELDIDVDAGYMREIDNDEDVSDTEEITDDDDDVLDTEEMIDDDDDDEVEDEDDEMEDYGTFSCHDSFLFTAAVRGHVEIVRLLLENGIDPNDGNGVLGPISVASQYGHLEIVELLIESGANVHDGGDYPLRMACRNGHYDIAHLLIENGADLHKNEDYQLTVAAENGHLEIVRMLLDLGANFSSDPLGAAAREGHSEVVRLLLEYGADVQKIHKGNWGIIIDSENVEILQLLVDSHHGTISLGAQS